MKRFNKTLLSLLFASAMNQPYAAETTTPAAVAPVPATSTASHPATAGHPAVNPHANFTHFRVGDRNVKRIFADGDIVWVGTSGGVIRYDTTTDQYKLFDVKSGLLAHGIFYLGKLFDRLAVGTYGGGLSILKSDLSGWDTYNVPEGLADAFVYGVQEMDNGDIWIATWSGANLVKDGDLGNPEKWETYTVENTNHGLPNDWVYALAKGKDGTIWFATEGGLAHFADGKWENWDHKKGVGAEYDLVKADIQYKTDPGKASKHHARQKEEYDLQEVDISYNPNYIISLAVDNDGSVWAGTWGGGLVHNVDGKITNYTTKDGLPGNHIFALHIDSKGTLWVGTSNGLAKMEDGKFKTYGTNNGLFANNVFSITSDQEGKYWIGSYGGVARINSLP